MKRSHGLADKIPEYGVWLTMRRRCDLPTSTDYHRYGARGISVCERWKDFGAFLADMGRRPSVDHTIERVDNLGNYEPGNVRWATRIDQANNRRSNHLLAHRGQTRTVAEWARISGLKAATLFRRIRVGWDVSRAITEPCAIVERWHRGGRKCK